MGIHEKRVYLEAIRARYRKAGRAEKGRILDEFCAVCAYHRKYALRRLNASPPNPACKKKPGRRSKYAEPAVTEPLRALWLATDQMASKRLKAAIPLWLPYFEDAYGCLDEAVRQKLLTVSAATIDRLLAPIRAQAGRHGMSGTKPGSLLKNQIPLQLGVWDVMQPGFMEADTVAHCGDSLRGSFVWSLTMTDLHSGWTECRATWNKGAEGVMAQILHIQAALPFTLKGFDCDNGSEFLNWHLLRYFQGHKQAVLFTRSRPYHSNDNAHVEQKNWSCVRQLFGYDRLEIPELVAKMNDLYANEFSLITNYFCPTMKLVSKKRIGAKVIKQHARPETPAQRLLNHPSLTDEQKQSLITVQESLNPFSLRDTIQEKLQAIFELVR